MKLAEALALRADLQRTVSQLTVRLCSVAVIQEGDIPAEDPDLLRRQLDETIATLDTLIWRINLTNASTSVRGETLTRLMARKDAMTMKIRAYRSVLDRLLSAGRVATRTEIRDVRTVDVPALRAETDRLSRELRELDAVIQMTNWNTELIPV